MPKIIIPQKAVGDSLTVVFNFSSYQATGDNIVSAIVTSVVYRGVDPSASGMVATAKVLANTTVTQQITNGVEGVCYTISCTAVMISGVTVTLYGSLSVLSGPV